MPKEVINGAELFYELDGTGEYTIVFLNGIMMSTVDWYSFVPSYNKHYSVLRLDFRNQGRSQYFEEDFSIDIHAEDLKLLLDRLNIHKVHLIGTSYGAEVAMLFALKYQGLLHSLVLSNTSYRVTKHMDAAKACWVAAAASYDGERFFKALLPFLYSPAYIEKNKEWLKRREKAFGKVLQKPWFEAFIKLAASTAAYDITEKLPLISVPTLCIAADLDRVTPLEEMKAIHEHIAGSEFAVLNGAGHAACFEQKDQFNQLVLDFLERNR